MVARRHAFQSAQQMEPLPCRVQLAAGRSGCSAPANDTGPIWIGICSSSSSHADPLDYGWVRLGKIGLPKPWRHWCCIRCAAYPHSHQLAPVFPATALPDPAVSGQLIRVVYGVDLVFDYDWMGIIDLGPDVDILPLPAGLDAGELRRNGALQGDQTIHELRGDGMKRRVMLTTSAGSRARRAWIRAGGASTGSAACKPSNELWVNAGHECTLFALFAQNRCTKKETSRPPKLLRIKMVGRDGFEPT